MTNRYNYAALVIAGLMSSSVAMAKNSGDVIQSGTGSVTINGSVTNTTCSASVDNATQRFVLSLQEINSVNNDEELVSIHSPITLNGCNGQWMNATITAARQLDGWYGSFNEQNTDMLAYQVGFQGDGVHGGALTGTLRTTQVNGTQNRNSGIVIQITSDSQKIELVTQVKKSVRRPNMRITDVPNSVSATYTYNMIYL